MSYWDPPEYIEEAKYPEIDAEINTLIEHLAGSIKEEAKDNLIDKIEFVIKNNGVTSTKYVVKSLNSSNSYFSCLEEELFENQEEAN